MPRRVRDTAGSRIVQAGEIGGASGSVVQFVKELQDATKELGDFSKVTEATTRGISAGARGAVGAGASLLGAGVSLTGVGFAKNTAMKVARQTVRAAGFDIVNFVATQGLGAAGDPSQLAFSAAKGLAQNPTLAKAFKLDLNLQPFLQAGQRTLGITGALARLGVDPAQIAEVREATFKAVTPEEKRAAVEARAVEEMTRKAAGTEALQDVEAFVGELQGIPEAIKSAIEGAFNSAITKLMIHFGAAPSGGGGGATAGAAAGLQ